MRHRGKPKGSTTVKVEKIQKLSELMLQGYSPEEIQAQMKISQGTYYRYFDTAMGKALEDKEGFVKFLVDKKDRKILGCHIIGTDALTLIHEVLVAMRGAMVQLKA
ncbi:MAG: hypothetical protein ACREAE_07185 [Nitrosopumilaceae archaeon]